MLILMLRSWRTGLISLLPNLVPAAMGFGIWGYFRGDITLPLSLVATMTLGIIVDDTVHFLSKYNRARMEKQMDVEQAIFTVLERLGPALIITSIMLVSGFMTISLSWFAPNASVGILTTVVITIALIADFLFLPPILMLFDREA